VILVGCMAVLTLLLLPLQIAGTVDGFVLLALIGFFCVGNLSITVVLRQEYSPTVNDPEERSAKSSQGWPAVWSAPADHQDDQCGTRP